MNKPTDAEIDAVLCNHWPAFSMQATLVRMWLRDAMRASLDKWGQPVHSGEPVAYYQPDDPSSSSAFSWPGSERNTAHNKPLFTAPQPVEREPLTPREIELIDGMIAVQLDHAMRCDAIANRAMADKQKGWDMERVALLQKFKAAHGSQGGQHGTE